ncbi:hypothetical protein V4R08_00160 [Nitrobacter sp. NHB1]|uniref:hypothetical protein n=1 Tax=Nitrobacter sp. NHB1 TaxID=3119830 RepID=UPI00300043CE
MQTSIFIARLIGPVMMTAGLAVLLNRQSFHSMAEEFLASRALMFLAGLMVMPAGLAIVLTHNVWTADWRVIVTLFGWLLVIAGAIRIVEPPFLFSGARAFLRHAAMPILAGCIWLVIGLVFCLLGYLH